GPGEFETPGPLSERRYAVGIAARAGLRAESQDSAVSGPTARWLTWGALVCLCGCGRYADFTLPPVSGGDPKLSWVFEQRPDPVQTRAAFHDALNPSVLHAADGY